MADFLDKFSNNEKLQTKVENQTKESNPTKNRNTRRPKSVLIDYPLYKKLKIVSAEKDMQMKEIVAKSLKAWFNNHDE